MKYTWKSVRSKILDYEGLEFESLNGKCDKGKKKEISKTTVKHAIQLADMLESNGFTAPDVVYPRKYNGVSFEWQKKTKTRQKCLQITATSSRKVTYFLDAETPKGTNSYVIICSKLDRTTSKKMGEPLKLTYETYKNDKNLSLLQNYDGLDRPSIYIGLDK